LPPGLAEVIAGCMQKNPAQRFATMDELVNALVQIYRGMVGPGMSTYMDAFPVMPSSAHQVQPTPPPMTGAVMTGPPMTGAVMTGRVRISGAQAATIAATAPSGSAPFAATPTSGVYPGVRVGGGKRKAGLIAAVLAVLAVGGGIAAFAVVSSQKSGKGS